MTFTNLKLIKSFEYWNIFDLGFIAGWHIEDREYVYNRFLRWMQHYSKEIKHLNKEIRKIDQHVRFKRQPLPSVRRLYNNLNERVSLNSFLRNNLMDEFDLYLQRRYNDQTVFDQKKNREFRPYHVAKKIDLMTRNGVDRTNHIIVNESRAYFAFGGLGRGLAQAKPSDEGLQDEVIRIPINSTGTISALGDSLRTFMIFPNGIESGYYSEHAVFDALVGGVCWYHVTYPANRLLKHEEGATFPTTSHYIYTRPV